MAQFGGRSLTALKNAHPSIVRVMNLAIISCDFMVIQSARTQDEQEADYKKGVSRAHWQESAHDFNPSFAVDCAPLPLNWNDIHSFEVMAAVVKAAGQQLNIPISWGGDWHSIKDYPHFELANWRELAVPLIHPKLPNMV